MRTETCRDPRGCSKREASWLVSLQPRDSRFTSSPLSVEMDAGRLIVGVGLVVMVFALLYAAIEVVTLVGEGV